jgi:hypothetical protein
MFSVSPILAYCARIQLFGTFFGSAYPSKKHVFMFSIFIYISSLVILYFFYDSLDKVLSILGAGAGFVLIYLIPSIVNMIYFKLKHHHLYTALESLNTNYNISQEQEEIIKSIGISNKPYNRLKNILFYTTQGFTILLGLFVLVSQFVDIKFYKIQINKN